MYFYIPWGILANLKISPRFITFSWLPHPTRTLRFLLLLLLLLLLLCSTFLEMVNDIGSDKKQQRYISKKMINIAIRATYYIFCFRKRNWDSLDLMQFRILGGGGGLLFLFCFCFFFLFHNPISSSICKLPIRSEIYNCPFKNTNKVSIIIIPRQ